MLRETVAPSKAVSEQTKQADGTVVERFDETAGRHEGQMHVEPWQGLP